MGLEFGKSTGVRDGHGGAPQAPGGHAAPQLQTLPTDPGALTLAARAFDIHAGNATAKFQAIKEDLGVRPKEVRPQNLCNFDPFFFSIFFKLQFFGRTRLRMFS